jgi:exonuclease-1
VSEFAGQYVGVDALCWLHRGSYGCAMDLVLGKPTNKHIEFCKNMLNMLIANNLKPILVFDGPDKPKMKNSTAESRRESRRKNKSEAMKYLGEGDMSKAIQMFQRAVHVTDDMINGLMNLLKEMKIPFIRAPHEGNLLINLGVLCKFIDRFY